MIFSCKKHTQITLVKTKPALIQSFTQKMAGVHVWYGTMVQTAISYDSTHPYGMMDTIYSNLIDSYTISVLNESTIINKSDTLQCIGTDFSSKTITFYRTNSDRYYATYDSIIYNYSKNSIIWHEFTTNYNYIITYISLHTP